MDIERRRALDAIRLQAELQRITDRSRVIEALALSALKGLTIINGGAVIAIFTLLGANTPFLQGADPRVIFWAVGAFATGLTLALIATLVGFTSQQLLLLFEQGYVHSVYQSLTEQEVDPLAKTTMNWGNRLIVVATFIALLSLASFVVGSILAVQAGL